MVCWDWGWGMEPADKRTLQRPPRARHEGFLTLALRRHIAWIGGLIGVVALGVGYAYYQRGNTSWQTVIFTTLAFLQIGQALASRSTEESLFTLGLRSNPTLLVMALIVFGLQMVAIYVPFFDEFFGVTPLSALELALSATLGSLAFLAIELEKWLLRRLPHGDGSGSAWPQIPQRLTRWRTLLGRFHCHFC